MLFEMKRLMNGQFRFINGIWSPGFLVSVSRMLYFRQRRKVRTMRLLIFSMALLTVVSCKKDTLLQSNSTGLQLYVDQNTNLERDDLIACAGGTGTTFVGDSINPVSVFFYPEAGAYEFRYFETSSISVDNANLNNYEEKSFNLTDLFNGTMKKFDHPAMNDERWGIVTFKTAGKLHLCNPIRLKSSVSPTTDISNIIQVTDNGTTPGFDWTAENEPNNVIYFSIVSDTLENLISGTYTTDKFWTFYDLSNVVLNVTPTSNPTLQAMTPYNYALMGVSEDNWVHTFGMKAFQTQ